MNEGLQPSVTAVGCGSCFFEMKPNNITLGRRLAAIAAEVRENVTLYDVGTDHAYLPVSLVQAGRIASAVASDVVPGPLARASETVARAGLEMQITLCLADGLQGIMLMPPCDVTVAGMGGELIASILAAAPQVRAEGVRLILQPMTKPEALRRYLAEAGYAIERDFAVEDGKLYEIIVCHYDGIPYALREDEALLGRCGKRCEDERFYRLVGKKTEVLRRKIEGQRRSGSVDPEAEALFASLVAILEQTTPKGEIP